MIVKVQLGATGQVLIYDQTRRYRFEGPSARGLRLKMNGRQKAFFHAQITEEPPPPGKKFVGLVSLYGAMEKTMIEATCFAVGDEAPWQGW